MNLTVSLPLATHRQAAIAGATPAISQFAISSDLPDRAVLPVSLDRRAGTTALQKLRPSANAVTLGMTL